MDLLFCKRKSKHLERTDTEDDDPEDEARYLAQKSGFVSLRDRMTSLAEQTKNSNLERSGKPSAEGIRQSPQFATLHELFASKSISQRPHSVSSDIGSWQHTRRHKIPVMKLNKDDWNVKCWEDRLSSHKRRQQENNLYQNRSYQTNNFQDFRSRKPTTQVEVFRGRIEDVATKLEKVREGAPQDEELYKLTVNGGRETKTKSSHEWTDLLKRELERGTHDPKVLRSKLAVQPNDRPIKSPLGRPIRRIFQDDNTAEED